jgi:hypothetical protein
MRPRPVVRLLAALLAAHGAACTEAPPPAPPPPAPPPAPPAPPTVPAAAPPADLDAPLRAALTRALRPVRPAAADDPEGRGEFDRVRDLVDRWAAAAPRHPLAAARWWRDALRRAGPSAAADRRGIVGGAVAWGGRPYPILVSVPPGDGPFPCVLALVAAEPREEIHERWPSLLATHLVIAVPCHGPVARDPELLFLAVDEAGRRWPLDRDRVVLDGTGFAAATVAAVAPAEAPRLAGLVLREGAVPAATNLAEVPILALPPPGAAPSLPGHPRADVRPGGTGREAEAWIAALPPRPGADPLRPVDWRDPGGARPRARGPGFLVLARRPGAERAPVRVALRRDPARNAVLLETENVARIRLLLADEVLDLDRPVLVVHGGRTVAAAPVPRSLDTVRTWALQEPGLFVAAEWDLDLPE